MKVLHTINRDLANGKANVLAFSISAMDFSFWLPCSHISKCHISYILIVKHLNEKCHVSYILIVMFVTQSSRHEIEAVSTLAGNKPINVIK